MIFDLRPFCIVRAHTDDPKLLSAWQQAWWIRDLVELVALDDRILVELQRERFQESLGLG